VQARVVEREEAPYRRADRIVYVDQLCVATAAQRRGHGGRLLEAVKQRARELEISRIELDTWTLNREARGFFAAAGFQEINIRLALDE
jgi:ribosomal protein S18 acetylase RimI-like enzyme